MSALAPYVRILGRGTGRARGLTRAEAREAMALMLAPDAAPEAVGAILMLLRMRGETAAEIAGFAEAAQAAKPALAVPVDLDWPSYAAGRSRGAPWFVLSARLVAAAGHRVLLHGWNGADARVRAGVAAMGIAASVDPDVLRGALAADGIAYMPLEAAAPGLFALLNLREVLGLRSCINTVCRMVNPGRAQASVQGVFHPSYRQIQSDAAALLGWPNLSVIKGGGGEFEVNPCKDLAVFGRRQGVDWVAPLAARQACTVRLAEGAATDDLVALWSGDVTDTFAEDVVIATAALALDTLGVAAPTARAEALWQARDRGAATGNTASAA